MGGRQPKLPPGGEQVTFPWMQSKYTDKALVCAICGQWISVGEPRRYNQQSKVSAHDACVGAHEMRDHMSHEAPAPAPPPQASPELESREAAIERMHKDKMDAFAAISDEIRRLKASVVEQNMFLSVFVEAYLKTSTSKPPEGAT